MALNDVSLTSGMRSNLLSLQNTVDLLNRTQSRLSTGKKVNSAIDNPVSFFASQALNSRASKIDSLKDAMGQAVQTITAADKGITAITAMIEQAKGIAQSALSAPASTGFDTETVTLNSVAVGDTITFVDAGGTTLTAGPTATVTNYTSFTLAFAEAMEEGDIITIGGVSYVASAGTGGTDFEVGNGAAADATALATAIGLFHGGAYGVANDGNGTLTITAGTAPLNSTTVARGVGTTAAEVAVASTTTTSAGALGALEFARTGDDVIDAQALANLINGNNTITTAGYAATASNGVLSLTKSAGDIIAGNITVSDAATMVEASVEADSELKNLMDQYNELRTQLTELAEDSGYKGKNLLSDDDLVVQFEGNTLTVAGFDASSAGLGVTAATWTTGVAQTKIDADIVGLDAALDTLSQESSKMSGNLSIITVRQDFSTKMINTLTEGSDKLTLADTNQEGANMLMLQTRQSLSTTALSLSAQAAQSVLRLFQ